MKFKNVISVLVMVIAILALGACAYGVFSGGGPGSYEFLSINGENVQIYGKGLYQKDSISIATQGIAQDIVTMVLGIPLLLIALYSYRRDSLKGRLLLTGTIGYFLYTYASYCFVWMYNSFFLIYVALMSASFFAFVLTMMSFDIENLRACFKEELPVKRLGGFSILFGVMIALMWIGKIVPALLQGTLPAGLDHYPTLIIQALDLGFIVPAAILSGILLMKKRPFGYLLSSIIYMKGITMATAVTAMLFGQMMAGLKVGAAEILIFPLINIGIIYCMYQIVSGINEPGYKVEKTAKQFIDK